jgi:adenylate cyclase
VDAVAAAVEIQEAMPERSAHLGEDRSIALRIGVNMGDVVVEDGDIFGDGVNIAARLQEVANPNGVAISDGAHRELRGKLDLPFTDAGEKTLKNIKQSVRTWLWSLANAPRNTARSNNQPALPDKPSIVVLPFDNLSGDPEQEYFADAVVEALTAELSRIRAFFVIARNSAFVYKGQATNVRDIGCELGVAYVLEGSVQRAGGRVRITVQLIETEGGAHVWADRYDGSLDDIFDLQDQITAQVAGALQPSIRLAEVERASRKRPQDLGAYDYTMRAFRHVWVLEKDEATKALVLLNKALEIDANYPLALALAAWCHAQRSVYNWVNDIETTKAKALAHAEQATNLSADDPLILTVLGAVHTFARNYGAARILLERAVVLDPNAAWAWSRLGWLETYADRPDEALTHFEQALRLSPVDPMNFNNYVGIGSAHQVAGDDIAAADMFLRAINERPNAHWIHRSLAPALWGAGREREARASFDTLKAAYPDMTVKRFKDAMVFSQKFLDRVGAQLLELGLPET